MHPHGRAVRLGSVVLLVGLLLTVSHGSTQGPGESQLPAEIREKQAILLGIQRSIAQLEAELQATQEELRSPRGEGHREELTQRIKTWGERKGHPIKALPSIARIDAKFQNQFGRPVKFLFTDSAGGQYLLSSEEARQACNAGAADGAPTLPSGFFKTINEPTAIRFVEGHGNGHGVGLCQWCTEIRAERGMKAEKMVLAAYPHAKLVYAYEP